MKKITSRFLAAAIAAAFWTGSSLCAAVPNEISYQGRLRESGQPVSGQRTMRFNIYMVASGGSPVWNTGDVDVQVSTGVFRYTLSPTGINWNEKDFWIETVVAGETLSPREKISAVAFALKSGDADTLASRTYDSFVSTGSESQDIRGNKRFLEHTVFSSATFSSVTFSSATFSGKVGIGTLNPATKLGVQSQNHNDWLIEALQTDGQKGVQIGMWDSDNSAIRLSDSNQNEKILMRALGSSYFMGGNVGIGTTDPSANLQVVQDVAGYCEAVARSNHSGWGAGFFAQNNSGHRTHLMQRGSAFGGVPYGPFGTDGNNAGSLLYDGDKLLGIGTVTNTPLYLGTNNTTRMTVTSDGNVGIGTTEPGQKLTVAEGNILLDNSRYLAGKDTTGTARRLIYLDSANKTEIWAGNGEAIRFFNSTGSSETMTINTISGNVGIRTVSPEYDLDIVGAAGAVAQVRVKQTSTSQNAHITVEGPDSAAMTLSEYSSGAGGTVFGVPLANKGRLHYSGSSAMIIGATQNVPVYVGSNNIAELMVTNGRVTVGGTTEPGTNKFMVVGSAGKTVDGTAWANLSDSRLKTIKGPIKKALSTVNKLRPVEFNWNELRNSRYGPDPGLKRGFIAQEIKEVIPEFVTVDANGYHWYNPSGMEAILTAAVQELHKNLELQSEMIAELKKEIEILKNK